MFDSWEVNLKYLKQKNEMLEIQTFSKVFELPSEEEIQKKWNEIKDRLSYVPKLNKIIRIIECSFYKNSSTFCLKVVYEEYVLKEQYKLPDYHQVIADLELIKTKEKELKEKSETIRNKYFGVNIYVYIKIYRNENPGINAISFMGISLLSFIFFNLVNGAY